MAPRRALQEVAFHSLFIPGRYRSGGAQAYVQAGEEIPDFLLPGRFIECLPEVERSALRGLTSEAAADVADWYVKQLVS